MISIQRSICTSRWNLNQSIMMDHGRGGYQKYPLQALSHPFYKKCELQAHMCMNKFVFTHKCVWFTWISYHSLDQHMLDYASKIDDNYHYWFFCQSPTFVHIVRFDASKGNGIVTILIWHVLTSAFKTLFETNRATI